MSRYFDTNELKDWMAGQPDTTFHSWNTFRAALLKAQGLRETQVVTYAIPNSWRALFTKQAALRSVLKCIIHADAVKHAIRTLCAAQCGLAASPGDIYCRDCREGVDRAAALNLNIFGGDV